MRHRLAGAILLIYPRRVRRHHGSEIVSLIDDLIALDGRSRARLLARLAADGLALRLASTATAWIAAAVLAATSIGGLAVSDFAAASAHQDPPRTMKAGTLASGSARVLRLPALARQPDDPVAQQRRGEQHGDYRSERSRVALQPRACRLERCDGPVP